MVEALLDIMPSDLPDLRESTNHLLPLKLPGQLAIYLPGREDRWGFQVGSVTRKLDGGSS